MCSLVDGLVLISGSCGWARLQTQSTSNEAVWWSSRWNLQGMASTNVLDRGRLSICAVASVIAESAAASICTKQWEVQCSCDMSMDGIASDRSGN